MYDPSRCRPSHLLTPGFASPLGTGNYSYKSVEERRFRNFAATLSPRGSPISRVFSEKARPEPVEGWAYAAARTNAEERRFRNFAATLSPGGSPISRVFSEKARPERVEGWAYAAARTNVEERRFSAA